MKKPRRMNPKEPEASDEDLALEEDVRAEETTAQKVRNLRVELSQLQKERSEYLDGWQRAKADLINTRREFEERHKTVEKRAQLHLLEKLLPILDSFDMAFRDKEAWEETPLNWRQGIEYIHGSLLSLLKEEGIEPFEAVDEPFDPAFHECVEVVAVQKKKEVDRIIETLQRGWKHEGVVIRPAKVRVGKAKGG